MTQKNCPSCNNPNLTEQDFYQMKSGNFRNVCKKCYNKQCKEKKAHYASLPVSTKNLSKTKWCNGCKCDVLIENFALKSSNKDKLDSLCKKCNSKENHNYYVNNKGETC